MKEKQEGLRNKSEERLYTATKQSNEKIRDRDWELRKVMKELVREGQSNENDLLKKKVVIMAI